MLITFYEFTSVLLDEMKAQGRRGTRASYQATICSVLSYSSDRHILLNQVLTQSFLLGYQEHLLRRGCCYNTISSYMRVLRAIRNKAEIRKQIVTESDLFSHIYTGREHTVKRAISPEVLLKINNADLSAKPHLIQSRDFFMLLFYLQGISYVDLAYLRKSDLKGDVLCYHRRKSGSPITVKIQPPARLLLNRYMNRDRRSVYLFDIISAEGDEGAKQCKSALRKLNRHLKDIASYIGLEENLTSYVSRHSWATMAYHNGVPTAMIGQALGHRSEGITRVYLASFDTESMAYANQKVLEVLLGKGMRKNKNWNGRINISLPKGKRHKYQCKHKQNI